MTLKELKENVLKMIEEISDDASTYTDDPDIEKKLNTVINQIMYEMARIKKIPAIKSVDITENQDFDLTSLDNFYQLDHIEFIDSDGEYLDFGIFGNIVDFNKVGTAKFYYYKYPTKITDDTDDETYTFELSDDALQVVPYGIAADLLKSDVSANYGNIYSNRYEQMLQRLDPRYSQTTIYIDTNEVL